MVSTYDAMLDQLRRFRELGLDTEAEIRGLLAGGLMFNAVVSGLTGVVADSSLLPWTTVSSDGQWTGSEVFGLTPAENSAVDFTDERMREVIEYHAKCVLIAARAAFVWQPGELRTLLGSPPPDELIAKLAARSFTVGFAV